MCALFVLIGHPDAQSVSAYQFHIFPIGEFVAEIGRHSLHLSDPDVPDVCALANATRASSGHYQLLLKAKVSNTLLIRREKYSSKHGMEASFALCDVGKDYFLDPGDEIRFQAGVRTYTYRIYGNSFVFGSFDSTQMVPFTLAYESSPAVHSPSTERRRQSQQLVPLNSTPEGKFSALMRSQKKSQARQSLIGNELRNSNLFRSVAAAMENCIKEPAANCSEDTCEQYSEVGNSPIDIITPVTKNINDGGRGNMKNDQIPSLLKGLDCDIAFTGTAMHPTAMQHAPGPKGSFSDGSFSTGRSISTEESAGFNSSIASTETKECMIEKKKRVQIQSEGSLLDRFLRANVGKGLTIASDPPSHMNKTHSDGPSLKSSLQSSRDVTDVTPCPNNGVPHITNHSTVHPQRSELSSPKSAPQALHVSSQWDIYMTMTLRDPQSQSQTQKASYIVNQQSSGGKFIGSSDTVPPRPINTSGDANVSQNANSVSAGLHVPTHDVQLAQVPPIAHSESISQCKLAAKPLHKDIETNLHRASQHRTSQSDSEAPHGKIAENRGVEANSEGHYCSTKRVLMTDDIDFVTQDNHGHTATQSKPNQSSTPLNRSNSNDISHTHASPSHSHFDIDPSGGLLSAIRPQRSESIVSPSRLTELKPPIHSASPSSTHRLSQTSDSLRNPPNSVEASASASTHISSVAQQMQPAPTNAQSPRASSTTVSPFFARASTRLHGISPIRSLLTSPIKKLPRCEDAKDTHHKDFLSGDQLSQPCPVCRETLADVNVLGVLACNHIYCFDCINTWAGITNYCCLCKIVFPAIHKYEKLDSSTSTAQSVTTDATENTSITFRFVSSASVAHQRQRIANTEEEDLALVEMLAREEAMDDDYIDPTSYGTLSNVTSGNYIPGPNLSSLSNAQLAEPPNATGQFPPDIDWHCKKCDRSDNDAVLLLCDGCDASWHTYCLPIPLPCVPDGLWLCGECEDEKHQYAREGKLPIVSTAMFVKMKQDELALKRIDAARKKQDEASSGAATTPAQSRTTENRSVPSLSHSTIPSRNQQRLNLFRSRTDPRDSGVLSASNDVRFDGDQSRNRGVLSTSQEWISVSRPSPSLHSSRLGSGSISTQNQADSSITSTRTTREGADRKKRRLRRLRSNSSDASAISTNSRSSSKSQSSAASYLRSVYDTMDADLLDAIEIDMEMLSDQGNGSTRDSRSERSSKKSKREAVALQSLWGDGSDYDSSFIDDSELAPTCTKPKKAKSMETPEELPFKRKRGRPRKNGAIIDVTNQKALSSPLRTAKINSSRYEKEGHENNLSAKLSSDSSGSSSRTSASSKVPSSNPMKPIEEVDLLDGIDISTELQEFIMSGDILDVSSGVSPAVSGNNLTNRKQPLQITSPLPENVVTEENMTSDRAAGRHTQASSEPTSRIPHGSEFPVTTLCSAPTVKSTLSSEPPLVRSPFFANRNPASAQKLSKPLDRDSTTLSTPSIPLDNSRSRAHGSSLMQLSTPTIVTNIFRQAPSSISSTGSDNVNNAVKVVRVQPTYKGLEPGPQKFGVSQPSGSALLRQPAVRQPASLVTIGTTAHHDGMSNRMISASLAPIRTSSSGFGDFSMSETGKRPF